MSYRVLPLLLAPLLAACALHPAATPAPAQPVAAAEPAYRPIPADTLEALLTAEMAALRQRPDITLSNYVAEARKTRDPAVVARATAVAQVLNQPQSLEMSQLWTTVEPGNADAWYLLVLNSLRQLRFDIAIPALNSLLALKPEADLEQVFIAAIPASQPARDQLFTELGKLARRHPDNAHLLFGQALLKAQSQQPAAALEIARSARRLQPGSPQIILLEARMLSDLGRDREASRLLRDALAAQPESNNLRLNHARLLIREGDLDGAEREFQTLQKNLPTDENVRLSLALIAFDNHHDKLAREQLTILSQSEEHADEAFYYLGMLDQRAGDNAAAMSNLENVQPGSNQYLSALAEISRMLIRDGQLDEARSRLAQLRAQLPEMNAQLYMLEAEMLSESGQPQAAWELLNEALERQPDNSQLLLSRAMVEESLDRLDDFEADLREVLRYEPDNPNALNALGYTLVDRTSRLDEGEAYVRRAYSLKPNDPAIIDSLGWIKFKRGDNGGALIDLQRAYALFPDDEIAAHLGEVLWTAGKHSEARRIWADSLRLHPKSPHIPRTRQRLDPS